MYYNVFHPILYIIKLKSYPLQVPLERPVTTSLESQTSLYALKILFVLNLQTITHKDFKRFSKNSTF